MSKELTRKNWELTPEELYSGLPSDNPLSKTIGGKKVKLKDIGWFLDKLATTNASGLPVYRAMNMLAEMKANTPIGAVILSIKKTLEEGGSVSQAFRNNEKIFGALVCALVEVGEARGNLEVTLRRASDLTNARLRLNRQVRGALVYPTMILSMTFLLVGGFLVFLVPKIEGIYAAVSADLPAPTRALLFASDISPFIFGALALLALAGFMIVKQSEKDINLRRRIDSFKLNLPLVGKIIRQGVNARIAATLASLSAGGVPQLETLEYAARVADNVVYADALNKIRQQIMDGRKLSEAIAVAEPGLFPPLLVQLTMVGEETSQLPELLASYAEEQEKEVAAAAQDLVKLVEPLTVAVLGVVIGIFVICLYLPMMQLGDQIG